jgi:hypothetical protein
VRREELVGGLFLSTAKSRQESQPRSRVWVMNKFRQLGLIEYDGDTRGEIKVNRSLLNLALHEKPQITQRD